MQAHASKEIKKKKKLHCARPKSGLTSSYVMLKQRGLYYTVSYVCLTRQED